ncbi:MAG: 2-phospho-L-lactate transferase [Gammaproteobacteria bacterium]
MHANSPRCTVLTGGIGGAKLVLGLAQNLGAEYLSIIVNTGDDFEHLGLPISPDLDTLMYTLAGKVNPETGWGLVNESWDFMDALEALNGETWFRLGDRDLATHVSRAQLLGKGLNLTEVSTTLYRTAGIDFAVMPMSDDPVRTRIQTDSELLDFQDYFVRQQAQPTACSIEYAGAESAKPGADVLSALNNADLILIAPSNPWLSIDPILSLSDIKATLIKTNKPVLGISPIVNGRAIKGPTAKLMSELGLEVSALAIAQHYADILDGFIIDNADTAQREAIEDLGIRVGITNTIMHTLTDKTALAEFCLQFAKSEL